MELVEFPETWTFKNITAVKISRLQKALLCYFFDSNNKYEFEQWVPFSQLDKRSPVKKPGDKGDLITSMWYARKLSEKFQPPEKTDLTNPHDAYKKLTKKYHPDLNKSALSPNEVMADLNWFNDIWQEWYEDK